MLVKTTAEVVETEETTLTVEVDVVAIGADEILTGTTTAAKGRVAAEGGISAMAARMVNGTNRDRVGGEATIGIVEEVVGVATLGVMIDRCRSDCANWPAPTLASAMMAMMVVRSSSSRVRDSNSLADGTSEVVAI